MKISPSGVALVCSGGHLDIACTTNGSFLRWHIRSEIENDAIRTYTRVLSSGIRVSTVAPLMINNTMFSFSRTSPQGTLPLTSRLAVNPVSEILNGTEVKCEDVIVNTNSSTTIINVIRGDVGEFCVHSLGCI